MIKNISGILHFCNKVSVTIKLNFNVVVVYMLNKYYQFCFLSVTMTGCLSVTMTGCFSTVFVKRLSQIRPVFVNTSPTTGI